MNEVKVQIDVKGISQYDFKNDEGQRVEGAKISYDFDESLINENRIGLKTVSITVDRSNFDKFKGKKTPVKCELTLDITDLSRAPRVKDLKVLG